MDSMEMKDGADGAGTPVYVSLRVMARRMGYSKEGFRRIVVQQNVPCLKVGCTYRFKPEEVERFFHTHSLQDARA